MTRRVLPLTALLALSVATGASAARFPFTVTMGASALHGDRLQVWANSPEAAVTLDNQGNSGFMTMSVQWQNLMAGSYVATPEGVVIGSNRESGTMGTSLTVPPGERQSWAAHPNVSGAYRFGVIGKTKNAEEGQRTFGELSKRMAGQKEQFALHLGDAVAEGNVQQLALFREQLKSFPFPTYAMPGNDDLAGAGKKTWNQLFGQLPMSFKVDKDRFVMVDNSAGTLSKDNRAWLERALQQANDERARHIFVFLHDPPVDPRPGINRGMTNKTEVRSLLALFQQHHVHTVFSSHLPFYSHEVRRGVHYVITGGGGDRLYGSPKSGGFHHFVQVEVNGDNVTMFPVRVP